jgi:hypothetical protein
VGDRLGKLEQDTQGVIDHLTSSAQRAHFQQIYDAHPDFVEVVKRSRRSRSSCSHRAAGRGGATAAPQAINKLITDYKATQAGAGHAGTADAGAAVPAQAAPTAAPVDQTAVDAAEGVRSAGLRCRRSLASPADDFASTRGSSSDLARLRQHFVSPGTGRSFRMYPNQTAGGNCSCLSEFLAAPARPYKMAAHLEEALLPHSAWWD